MHLRRFVPVLFACAALPFTLSAQTAAFWLTNQDRSALLAEQPALTAGAASANNTAASGTVIHVDAGKTFQSIDGFGYALTGGSAQLLMKLDPAKRSALLRELFTTDGDGIGVSYLRLTVGASDMNDHVFSYDDLPKGETDVNLARFSLEPDRADVLPIMKEILAIQPKIKIMASPWSAPLWMKTTGLAQGGVLKPEFYAAYAAYFVKYIQAMQAEGIAIDALTVQNEPLNEKNTPSMLMLGEEQDVFIREHLGPAFRKAGIKTKIVLYDHNLDHPLYVVDILKDKDAAKYIDGSGWHLYGGTVDAMTAVHQEFPNKNIYFTEQSTTERRNAKPNEIHIAQPVARVMVGVSRNWSKNVLLWNLAADPDNGPHTDNGGCTGCSGALRLDGDDVSRLLAFYTVGHVSKFVPTGSLRVASDTSETLPNVAFKTPAGKTVLVVSNTSPAGQSFTIQSGKQSFTSTLKSGSVGTYVW